MRLWPLFQSTAAIKTLSGALPAEQLEGLTQELLSSAYLQQNVLNTRFASTLGFSVIFRQAQDLLRHFVCLQSCLPLLSAYPGCNLFYLNVLVIGAAGKVERHVDHSIRGYDSSLPLPKRVSVLYLQVPPMEGGALLLYDAADQLSQRLPPESGMLVHFPGHCKHAVEAIAQAEAPRVSLVCEQYSLSRRQLQALPEFSIKSMAPFEAFLKQQL